MGRLSPAARDERVQARWRAERGEQLRRHVTAIGVLGALLLLLTAPVDYLLLGDTPPLRAALTLRAALIALAALTAAVNRRRALSPRALELLVAAGFAAVLGIVALVAARAGEHPFYLDLGFGNVIVFLGVAVPWETWKTAALGAGAWVLYAWLAHARAEPGQAAYLAARDLLEGVFVFTAVAASWMRSSLLFRELCERVQLEDLSQDLSCLAERDDLTGLYNYRSFWSALREQLALSERSGRPLSLLLLDLDGFKAYNDTRGHLQGDALLRRFGALLAASLRSGDLAFRQGGDEFAVILPDTDEAAARQVAERLSERIAGGLCEEEGVHLITASIGVACSHAVGYDPQALVEEADCDLYRAKRGRGPATGQTSGGAA